MNEAEFLRWYGDMARRYKLSPDPDDPGQFYDYRAAYAAGAEPDSTGHWPSAFKRDGHPNMVVGGFNVKTGERVPGTRQASEAELVSLGWDAAAARRLSGGSDMPQQAGQVDIDALIREFGGVVGEGDEVSLSLPAAERPRPLDPQTGEPVRIPSDPGYVPFGDEPSRAPSGRSLENSLLRGAFSQVNPVNVISGLYNTLRHPIDTARGIAGAQVDQGRQAVELFRRGGVGNMVEGTGRALAAALPVVGPAAASVGEGIGSGDPERMATSIGEGVGMLAAPAVVGGLTRRAAPVLRRGAERIAERTMGAGDDVLAMTDRGLLDTVDAQAAARRQLAQTALDEDVLPRLIGGSNVAPRQRMAELVTQVRGIMDGPQGNAPVVPARMRGASARGLQDRLQSQTDFAGDVRTAGEVIRSAPDNARLGANPTARRMAEVTSNNISMVRGRPGVAADASRAVARDGRREVARAVPEAAPVLDRISRLEPVLEAFERVRSSPVEMDGLPTIQARIALAGVNRLAGPTARGMNAVSRVTPGQAGNATRAAVLAQLLGQQYGQ